MPYKMPQVCPSCHQPLVREGAHYFCPNTENCPDQVAQRLQHVVSKGALDWNGCGPAQVAILIDKCGCRNLRDLLALDPTAVKAVLGRGQAAKFLAERERVKKAPLWRKFVALGIDGVGQTACKELCSEWHDFGLMLRRTPAGQIVAADQSKLTEILGPIAATSFIEYAQGHFSEIECCEDYGYLYCEDAPAESAGPLAGKVFCITGAMTSGKRPQVAATIEKYGGTVKGSVSKGVHYLVVGEACGASKSAAAAKLSTKCISEAELYQMMGIEMPQVTGVQDDEF